MNDLNYYGYEFIRESDLTHHGILGQKWGVRRFQNKDGTLISAGRQRYNARDVQELEKAAIKNEYKRRKQNGGGFLFKSARISTGENFNKANADFDKVVASDKKYRDLSKKAFDAEKKRLMMEKSVIDKDGSYDEDAYDLLVRSKEYQQADSESKKATAAKNQRRSDLAKAYVDTIKEAKLNDLKITGSDREIAKKYVSDRFDDFYWDENLEYNPDNYYESWVEKSHFK